jgi:hypothetical protein
MENEKVIALGRLVWGMSSHYGVETAGILREICYNVAKRNKIWLKFLWGGTIDEKWKILLFYRVGLEYMYVLKYGYVSK